MRQRGLLKLLPLTAPLLLSQRTNECVAIVVEFYLNVRHKLIPLGVYPPFLARVYIHGQLKVDVFLMGV